MDSVSDYNGVTDFSGGSYDTFAIGPVPKDENSVEGMAAGGLRREPDRPLYNGVTDFSGASRDTGEIGL